MKTFYFIFLIIFGLSASCYGKETAKSVKQKLTENGVILTDTQKEYSDHQYYLLESFDFTKYRNFSTKRLVQIEDGPAIQLSSLSEMQSSGKQIPDDILQNKKNEVRDANLKSIITLVNIGFRYGPKLHTESGF